MIINNMAIKQRETWPTRVALIFAMSGASIGLGNFLRFPAQIIKSESGGSFMIPYLTAILILGIPMLWVEWSIGKIGGSKGYGSIPMIFNVMCKNKYAKYFGVFGLASPILISAYYTWATSWNLGYAFFSIFKSYYGKDKISFLQNYITNTDLTFPNIWIALIFFTITIILIYIILSKGVIKGITYMLYITFPVLFIFGILLTIRVLYIGPPILKGLAYIWEPNFHYLLNWKIWILAAGQVFFTLSVGMAQIPIYASYLREHEDVALGPLTQTSLNEFFEVIIGGSIAIPVVIALTGEISSVYLQGYNLAFSAMPMVIEQIHFGSSFGVIWFLLLFIAGFTTIIPMCLSFMDFLQSNFYLSTKKASYYTLLNIIIMALPVIFLYSKGVFDDIDFWVGSILIIVVSLLELYVFAWDKNAKSNMKILMSSNLIRLNSIAFYLIKYVVPFILLSLLTLWIASDGFKIILTNNKYLWFSRSVIIFYIIYLLYLIKISTNNKGES